MSISTYAFVFFQVFYSLVGSEPPWDLGEQGHLCVLHRLHHGADYAVPGPNAPHPHAGKRG